MLGQVVPKYLLLKAGIGLSASCRSPRAGPDLRQPAAIRRAQTTYVAGFETEPTATLNIQGQFFYKDLRSLVVSDPTTRMTTAAFGRVVGGDFPSARSLCGPVRLDRLHRVAQRAQRLARGPWRLFR